MKVLITESQLDRVVFKYLDNQNFIQTGNGDNIYFVYSEDDEYSEIRYHTSKNWCYIHLKLIEEISSLFSIGASESKQIISKWVENTLQTEISYAQWVVTNKSINMSTIYNNI
jgi:hypothetical protein